MTTTLLTIDGLSVDLATRAGPLRALDAIGLEVASGETVCLVGESGSGKTLTALTVMRLIEQMGGSITGGSIHLGKHDLASLSQRQMGVLRGRRIGMVFQDPMTAFDPLFSIGAQIAEVIEKHLGLGRKAARARAIDLLDKVRIADPHLRVDQYPHELSGGMRQRAMIAMALACDPLLLIADEPTTALDVTVQAQIMDVLAELQKRLNLGLVLITHDLGVLAGHADRVAVVYAGEIVEQASIDDLFERPSHPYTRGLIASIPNMEVEKDRLFSIEGSPPPLGKLPGGCSFHPRCPQAQPKCSLTAPATRHFKGHSAACHFADLATEGAQ